MGSDLDRIQGLEDKLGFKLDCIPTESLPPEDESKISNGLYSLNSNREVTGLYLKSINPNLISSKYIEFNALTKLILKDSFLKNLNLFEPLKNLAKEISFLDLSLNNLKDASILKEFKKLKHLNLNNNSISDMVFLSELKPV